MNNQDIIQSIQEQIISLSSNTTPLIRKISSTNFHFVKKYPVDNVFEICELMLTQKTWALTIIAYDWAYKMRNEYTENTFHVFEHWVYTYIKDWWDCDDFCTHAFGFFIYRNQGFFKNIIKWCESDNFAVRRSAAVLMIYSIKKNHLQAIDPFIISDILMKDPHYLVLKGVGWMLKVYSKVDPEKVINYLALNKFQMPKLSFRYAIENLSPTNRQRLLDKAVELN